MNDGPHLQLWTEAPEMDSGAPSPHTFYDGEDLFCAYRVRESEGFVVLRFQGVLHYSIGYPNDEALESHPLWKFGLRHYSSYVVENSPAVAELDRRNQVHRMHRPGVFLERFKHWIFTFHDETLEVIATEVTVVGPAIGTPEQVLLQIVQKD